MPLKLQNVQENSFYIWTFGNSSALRKCRILQNILKCFQKMKREIKRDNLKNLGKLIFAKFWNNERIITWRWWMMVMMMISNIWRWWRINRTPYTGWWISGSCGNGLLLMLLLLLKELLHLGNVNKFLEFTLAVSLGRDLAHSTFWRLIPGERITLEMIETNEWCWRIVIGAASGRMFASHRERQHLFNLSPRSA